MIRTLVVDDDFMAVSVHRDFLARVPGFEAVGEATTGAQALARVAELRPDLVLLDMYLPDLSGIEVLRRVRAASSAPLDVIAITSAKDVHILRGAMHLGVVHYIVKPFTFATFRERLESYAAARSRLDHMSEPDQRDIDRLYGLLRTSGGDSLPKGVSAPTLTLVADVLREARHGMSATELAARTGISLSVARRYLKFLSDSGTVDMTARYGQAGRPEHLYSWSSRPAD
ncbi:MAG TPA: response regulator [Candidatus Angelobacter sp.]|nr:response regulator [Candidatus Angelobacter sp.]